MKGANTFPPNHDLAMISLITQNNLPLWLIEKWVKLNNRKESP
jgi:hypothetical protein